MIFQKIKILFFSYPFLRFPGLHNRKGIFLALAANILWGTTFVVSQVALSYVNPYDLVFLRSLVGTIIILAIFIFTPQLRHMAFLELMRLRIWILSILYAVGFLLQYLGQDYSDASNATMLANLAPVFIPIMAALFLRDRITRLGILVMVMGGSGLGLMSLGSLHLNPDEILGDALLIGTSLSYSLFIVLSKRYRASGLESSFLVIILVTLMLLPQAIFLGHLGPGSFDIPIRALIDIIWLGATGTVIALALYLRALRSINATASGIFLLLQLVFGLVLAFLMLGERLSLLQMLGAALILSAIVAISFDGSGRSEGELQDKSTFPEVR